MSGEALFAKRSIFWWFFEGFTSIRRKSEAAPGRKFFQKVQEHVVYFEVLRDQTMHQDSAGFGRPAESAGPVQGVGDYLSLS